MDARDAIAGACSSRSAGQAPRVAPELTPATPLRDVLGGKLATGFSTSLSRTAPGFLRCQAANTNGEIGISKYDVVSESCFWVSKDPTRFAGGLNLYGYCYGDPINFRDQTGRLPDPADMVDPDHWYAGPAGGTTLGQWLLWALAQLTSPPEPPGLWGIVPIVPVELAAVEGAEGAGVCGGRLSGYTRHGLNQAISRDGVGVSARAISEAVSSPQSVMEMPSGAIKYVGSDATVVVNAEGKVITTWATNSSGYRITP